ncbi:Rdl2 protein [Scheffersomyces amazonensis]|uniref:Rdl2 protein n=1 Tax=Scheffersomyces amazonensis TaxID=1078765 RepID=UPI00315DBE9D
MSVGFRSFKQLATVNRHLIKNVSYSALRASTIRQFSWTSTPLISRPFAGAGRRPINTIRFYGVITSDPTAKLYNYDDIKAIATHPEEHQESVLIDVREPVEYNDGHIPGSLNIPFKSSPGALDLNQEEFQENFGFEKPSQDKELVFYCLGGVRSTAAEELACTFGYKKRGNYVGSWEDWIAHENAKSDPPTSSSASASAST